MHQRFNLNRRKKSSTAPKPLSRSDLNQLGLDVDHFYHRFLELGQDRCPNCGHTGMDIHWLNARRQGGWRWRCWDCGQDWREPHLNDKSSVKLDVRELPRPEILTSTQNYEESEYADGFIRKYK